MNIGLPAGWTEAAADAQACLSSGDWEGLRLARARIRRAADRALTDMRVQARAPRPAPVTPGVRVARRLRRQKRERQRRALRWLDRLQGQSAPAANDRETILQRLDLQRATGVAGRQEKDGVPEFTFTTPEPTRTHGFRAAWTRIACEPGINAAKMDEQATTAATLDDLVDLGVAIIRHPGLERVDLSFRAFFGTMSGERLPPAGEVHSYIDARQPVFEEFLRELLDRGVQVVFTLGPHGTRTQQEENTTDGKVVDPIFVVWEDDSREHLDIRDPDHRAWLETFTQAVCDFLKTIEASIALTEPGFALADVIYGIELFNEIDMANTVLGEPHAYGETSWRATAEDWATILVQLARVIEGSFPNDAMKILLPGLSSWDISEDSSDQDTATYRLTWSWKVNFFRELVRQFADHAGRDAPRLAHGVDMHWYHRKQEGGDKNNAGPLHISRLSWECKQLYEALAEAGLDIDLTMFESGISVLRYIAGFDYHPPAMSDRDGMSALQVYQGQEVIRRLAGAAAGQTTVAGWHAWRSDGGPDEEWYGLGLRKDTVRTAQFNQARPRFSWLAYQRFWSLLGEWSSATMLLPPSSFRPVMKKSAGIATYTPGNEYTFLDGVVVEFTRVTNEEGPHCYGYLVFLDKWRGTKRVSMSCTPEGVSPVNATWHRMLPSSFDWESDADIGRDSLPEPLDVRFPRLIWSQVISATGATWTFGIDSDPILLLGDGRLKWTYAS